MMQYNVVALLGLAACIRGQTNNPYYANLTWQPARTLHSDWANLTVKTNTGTFIGLFNDTYPNVRQFLRVPFAQPPVGDLRWLPPQPPSQSNKQVDSTYYGPACPQYDTATPSIFNEYGQTSQLINIGEEPRQGAIAWSSAEDCLSLAIWTPSYANCTSKLPVALFVTGGGGVSGGIFIAGQLPSQWISRSQEHIVVTINYRVNIFGNPKSRALNKTSLTLLDVRAAVEWVSENIEAFGGDASNIMLWGQSQGAALTHLYTLAFPEDPLVAKFGMISAPPSVTINTSTAGDVYADFDIVAKGLGCNYGNDHEAELECMRHISWVQIEEYINRYNATPAIAFSSYIPDERYIFANENERYMAGQVAKGPAIRSDAAREGADQNTTAVEATEKQWICAATSDATMRRSRGLDTYRYEWAGNFTNFSPVPWLGAYHWSDLSFIFGTYGLPTDGVISQLEHDTSVTMQDYILAFLKDPSTLPETVGWVPFDASAADGGLILEFGNGTAVQNITGGFLDGGCSDSFIPIPING